MGALLGGAFLHLLPEALSRSPDARPVLAWLLLGFLAFFVLEKVLASRRRTERRGVSWLPPLAALNLVGDALHNLVDGMVIGAGAWWTRCSRWPPARSPTWRPPTWCRSSAGAPVNHCVRSD